MDLVLKNHSDVLTLGRLLSFIPQQKVNPSFFKTVLSVQIRRFECQFTPFGPRLILGPGPNPNGNRQSTVFKSTVGCRLGFGPGPK